MKTKRLKDLTQNDLLHRQVWEHWIENNIEFVRPYDKDEICANNDKGFIVLTTFNLNNGIELNGFCSPLDTSGLDYIQPVILTDNGQFEFWKDNDWSMQENEKELQKIGLNWQEIFPVVFMTMVKCENEFYQGRIVDFNRNK